MRNHFDVRRRLPWLGLGLLLALGALVHSTVVRARTQVLPVELESRPGGEAGSETGGALLLTGGVRAGSFVVGGRRIDALGSASAQALGDEWAPRAEHSATVLPDGRALIVGGIGDQGVTGDALLLSADGAQVRPLAAELDTPRAAHAATLLLDGRVLVSGGIDASGEALASIEVFDARAGADAPYDAESGAFAAWSARLVSARAQHTMTLLADGRLLVAGGRQGADDLASFELVDPVAGTVAVSAARLATARSEHSATLLSDGRVLIVGGRGAAGDLVSVEVYDPATDRCERVRGGLGAARANHVGVLASAARVLVVGGGMTNGEAVAAPAGERAVKEATVPTPSAGAVDVSVHALVGARLARPLALDQDRKEVRLTLSASGIVSRGTVAVAESGLYVFLRPDAPLQPATEYRAHLRVPSADGKSATETVWSFRTRGASDDDGQNAGSGGDLVLGNTAPVVNAGPDQKWNLPVRVAVTGIVTDDGLPNPPGAVTVLWQQMSGPVGGVTFTTPTFLTTSLIISQPGTYTIRLTANDSSLSSFDEFALVVTPRTQLTGTTVPDLLWQNRETGVLVAWQMSMDLSGDPAVFTKVGASLTPSPNTVAVGYQKVVGISDFNADGQNDILFQNQVTGRLYAWYMNGLTRSGAEQIPSPQEMPDSDPEWMVTATADFNFDGKPDLLLQHQTTGVLQVWFMNGLTRTSVGTPNPSQPASDVAEWKVIAAEDFNADGYADLLWQHRPTNTLVVWYMSGINRLSTAFPSPNAPASDGVNWNIVSSGDFDGDGKADLLWQHRNDGYLVVWWMNGINRTSANSPSPNRALDTWPSWPVVGNHAWKRGVLPLTLAPPSGAYTSSVLATLSNYYPNSARYTLDGTNPTVASTPYLQPVSIDQGSTPLVGKTIKAQSFWPGFVDSALVQATYTFQVATPTISLASSTSFTPAKIYPPSQKVAITCTTPGAVIRYSLNGLDPTESDPAISSGATLTLGDLAGSGTVGANSLVSLKAKAFKTNANASGTASATYHVSGRKSILYIAANIAAAPELAVKAHLEAMGFTVAMQDDNSAARNQAASHRLVIVSADVDPTLANVAAFWDVSTPMIALEPRLWDDFKLTGAITVADQDNQTNVNVVGVSHPTAANLSGTTQIYSAAAGVYWGTPGPSAVILARRIEVANRPAFFAYESGARLVGPDTAHGRRVATVNPKNAVTAQGWALFDAAVRWSLDLRFPSIRFLLGPSPAYLQDDQIAIDRLSSLGYGVYFSEGGWAPGDADGVAAVVISPSLSDSIPGFPWATVRALPYPIVDWQPTTFDDLSLALGRGTEPNQTQVRIAVPTHPLAAGFPAGLLTVNGSPETFGWCQINANGVGVAELPSDATKKTVFSYEYGVTMPGSFVAPDRRVGLFMADSTGGFSTLNANGWKLFDAAIDWATSGDVDGDGLNAREESRWGTNARDADSNDNGVPDGAEVGMGYDGVNPDSDGDGWTNAFELTKGTNPFDPDTDHDGVIDPLDAFPLDPTRWNAPTDPTPGLPPSISLVQPLGASLTNSTCVPVSPCP